MLLMEREEKAGSGHVDKTRNKTSSAHRRLGQKRWRAAHTRAVQETVSPASPCPPDVTVPDGQGALGGEGHSEPQSDISEPHAGWAQR